MTEESESGPWMVWAFKGMAVLIVTFLEAMAVFIMIALVPWMSGNIIGLTLLISGVAFLAGNVILLESKDARMWGYSIAAGFTIGIGGIVVDYNIMYLVRY